MVRALAVLTCGAFLTLVIGVVGAGKRVSGEIVAQCFDGLPRRLPDLALLNRIHAHQIDHAAAKMRLALGADENGRYAPICGKQGGRHPGETGADHHKVACRFAGLHNRQEPPSISLDCSSMANIPQ